MVKLRPAVELQTAFSSAEARAACVPGCAIEAC